MKSLCVSVCLAVVLVLQCCNHAYGVKCIKSDLCKCQTDKNFTIDLNNYGNDFLKQDVYDSQGSSYTVSPCVPMAGCQTKDFWTSDKIVCVYIQSTNDVLVLGRSNDFEWDVKSKNYFSVTFKNGSSVDATSPRQSKLIFIVDKTVSGPKVEYMGLDCPTNTYVFNIRVKNSYAPYH